MFHNNYGIYIEAIESTLILGAYIFWDSSNWQALCKHHHDVKTMTTDRYQEYHY